MGCSLGRLALGARGIEVDLARQSRGMPLGSGMWGVALPSPPADARRVCLTMAAITAEAHVTRGVMDRGVKPRLQ